MMNTLASAMATYTSLGGSGMKGSQAEIPQDLIDKIGSLQTQISSGSRSNNDSTFEESKYEFMDDKVLYSTE